MAISSDEMLASARRMLDWFVRNMTPRSQYVADSGHFPIAVWKNDRHYLMANEWNQAFAIMAMLSGYRVFGDDIYRKTARYMMDYLRSLQIFDPFHPEHYGAIREMSPQTDWCYVRDALSAAWAFLEYYRVTGEAEYLERARLWGEWYLKHGMDETGWPLWGLYYDPAVEGEPRNPMHNELHGCFHGGSLNFFYQLYRTTGDKKWVGSFFEKMADYFSGTIQQADGFFRSVQKSSETVPPQDPQNALHRGNDDLGTLGLLCAYQVYPKEQYLQSIRRFLTAVFQKQQERTDGMFENGCAAIPVVMNILDESRQTVDFPVSDDVREKALQALLARQFSTPEDPLFDGGLDEDGEMLCVRSMCYAIIWILKHYGKDDRFLKIN